MSLFNKIVEIENLYLAVKNTRRGRFKLRKAAISFKKSESRNILLLRDRLINKEYSPGIYNKFYVLDPKRRLIHAPKYEDKIVQHAINNILLPTISKTFIYDSYACIPNKGNERAVLRIQHFMWKAYHRYDEPYVVKIDIKKFFYTINRDILKIILSKKIKDNDLLDLLFKILDASPTPLGLPLGNLTSQILANLYLDQLDQYVKRTLSITYYVRYADDIVLIVNNKETAQILLDKIKFFLYSTVELEVHPDKTRIFPSKQGINALGFKIHAHHILLNRLGKNRIKKNVRKMIKQYKCGNIKKEDFELKFNTWYAFIKTSNCFNFIQKLVENNPELFIDDNDGMVKLKTVN